MSWRPISYLIAACFLLLPCSCALAAPTTLPAGYIVWSSARGGEINHIYRMSADGTGIVRLVDEESDYPRWSPDGRWISYVTIDATWIMHADGSGKKKLAAQIDFPEWSADGSALIGSQIDEQKRLLVRYDFVSGQTKTLVDFDTFAHLKGARIAKPALSPDGRWLFVMTDRFDGGYTATNGAFRPSGAWAAAALDLQNPATIYYVGDGCQPAVDPAGQTVFHSHGESGAIAQMKIGDDSRKSYQLLTKPEDEETLKKFYKTVNPWGWWGPIRAKVMQEDPGFQPNHSAVHDLTNVAVGIVWQLCLVTLPIYIVLRQWGWAGGIAVLLVATSIYMKFNWFDKLPAPTPDAAPEPQTQPGEAAATMR